MQKHYNYLNINLDKKIHTKLKAKQGDSKSRYILVNLISNNLYYDLTGTTVKIYGIKKDKTIFFNHATVTNGKQGQFEIELTTQALAVPGEIEIQILILGTNDEKLTTFSFFIEVEKTIINDAAIESTNEFTALTEALSSVQNIDNRFREVDEQFNTKTTYITPEMFGAVGDGTTDDLQAFKNMFIYMTNNAVDISIGGNELLKDFGGFNIVFSKKYAISDTIILPSCYNLKVQGLYITCTNNFISEFLMKSEGTFRNSHFSNCIFDGNSWKASCFLIESSSLTNRFDNCQFRRFKHYGFKGGQYKGHELIFSNCKFNQYEWGDEEAGIMPTTEGIGLYLPDIRGDNHISNCIFSYCLGSTLKLDCSCTLIENTHVYSRNSSTSYGVEIIGGYNVITNCYFDYTTILLRGFNSVKNNVFISDGANFNFIVLDETSENKWKYGTCQILGNFFKSSLEKITTPIKSLNFSITKNTMAIYDNSFDNCEVIYCEPHYNYCPSPFREFNQKLATTGHSVVGDLKFIWGSCSCGSPVTLACSEILNVQLTLYQDTELVDEKAYVSNVYGNKFTPKGNGYVYYFATCVE